MGHSHHEWIASFKERITVKVQLLKHMTVSHIFWTIEPFKASLYDGTYNQGQKWFLSFMILLNVGCLFLIEGALFHCLEWVWRLYMYDNSTDLSSLPYKTETRQLKLLSALSSWAVNNDHKSTERALCHWLIMDWRWVVSKLLKLNKSAIGKGYKQYQETGSVESRSRSGKPQNFTRCNMALSKKKGKDILHEIFNK